MNEQSMEPTQVTKPHPLQVFAVPIAIVIAGSLITGGVLFDSKIAIPPQQAALIEKAPVAEDVSKQLENIKPVSKDDHIRGNPNAPVKIVEYSDTECPFCKRIHLTMKQVMDEYGKDGRVAWVYRHFPLDQLHPIKAREQAVAFECANELGGNDKFWEYADRLYEITPSNNGLDRKELPKIAVYVGLDVAKFNTCLASGKFDKHIEEDVQNAIATGGRGTPWSILIAPDGAKFPINGALPFEAIKQLIDTALKSS